MYHDKWCIREPMAVSLIHSTDHLTADRAVVGLIWISVYDEFAEVILFKIQSI